MINSEEPVFGPFNRNNTGNLTQKAIHNPCGLIHRRYFAWRPNGSLRCANDQTDHAFPRRRVPAHPGGAAPADIVPAHGEYHILFRCHIVPAPGEHDLRLRWHLLSRARNLRRQWLNLPSNWRCDLLRLIRFGCVPRRSAEPPSLPSRQTLPQPSARPRWHRQYALVEPS